MWKSKLQFFWALDSNKKIYENFILIRWQLTEKTEVEILANFDTTNFLIYVQKWNVKNMKPI